MKKILLAMCMAMMAIVGAQVSNVGVAEAADIWAAESDGYTYYVVSQSATVKGPTGGEYHAIVKQVDGDGNLVSRQSYRYTYDMHRGVWLFNWDELTDCTSAILGVIKQYAHYVD